MYPSLNYEGISQKKKHMQEFVGNNLFALASRYLIMGGIEKGK